MIRKSIVAILLGLLLAMTAFAQYGSRIGMHWNAYTVAEKRAYVHGFMDGYRLATDFVFEEVLMTPTYFDLPSEAVDPLMDMLSMGTTITDLLRMEGTVTELLQYLDEYFRPMETWFDHVSDVLHEYLGNKEDPDRF